MQLQGFLPEGSDLTETKPNKTPLNSNKCSMLRMLKQHNIIGANDYHCYCLRKSAQSLCLA